MSVAIENSGPTLRRGQIKVAEARLGCALPDDYRDFLLQHNGGEPEPSCFTVLRRDGTVYDTPCVDRFLSINSADGDDIENVRAVIDDLPSHVLPIGYDSGANSICVAIAGPNQGGIYYFDDEAHLHFVAPSFSSFLESLHKDVSEE